MRQTLFYIPHEIFGWNMFGAYSLALIAWAILGGGFLVWQIRRHGWNDETRGYVPILGIMGLAAYFLTALEERVGDVVLGLAIRGYGVMLLLGVLAGISLAMHRAKRAGLEADLIYSLAMRMFIFGILGARLFYVAQYWENFRDKPAEILKFTEGGLVVYGSLVGGLAAAWHFLHTRKLPALAIGDLVAPALMAGLAIGRIGCLMNGCCYGGVCESGSFCISFPKGSPPYVRQVETGQILGLKIADNEDDKEVTDVRPDSVAGRAGIRSGDHVRAIQIYGELVDASKINPDSTGIAVGLTTQDRGDIAITYASLPPRSLPVQPTQIYSSINAGVLCLILWLAWPLRRRDGEVTALLLTLYPLTRFLIELVRQDEYGQLGTSLTISQLVSIGMLTAVAGLWVYVERQPRLQKSG